MKCLYCHENVQPEGDVCPKCGLPLIEDTTLLELAGPEKPSAADWLQQHKAILLAAAGGFATAVVIGLIVITAMMGRSSEPTIVVNPATARPLDPPVQMASRAAAAPYGRGGPVFPAARTNTAPAPAREVTPEPAASPQPEAPAAAPVASEPVTYEPPPVLPDDFEYDPQWGFPRPPKEEEPRRRIEPIREPTPPSHTLAMDPMRPRAAQHVTVIRNRGIDGVVTISSSEPVSLSSLEGE